MKKSIKRQLMIIFIGLFLILILALMFINVNFLEPYYIHKKEDAFYNFYQQISNDDTDVFTDSDAAAQISSLAERNNASYLLVKNIGAGSDSAKYLTNVNDSDNLMNQLLGYFMNQAQKNGTIIESTSKYQILQSTDPRTKTEYLAMWGTFGDDTVFLLRSPLESMKESAMISNFFVIRIGLSLIIVGILFIWYFSERLTKPIKQLTKLSDKMANLDFDAKYSGREQNEIGELGANFNRMSANLEGAISELKKANNDLQKDISRKEKEEELRNEFLGSVSHELKTPIALIQGYAEGLREGVAKSPEDQAYYCDVIMDEADKMNKMVRSLLTLNELEIGKDNLVFERFYLTRLVQGVIDSMDILAKQEDVKIIFKPTEDYHAWGDELKVEQVIRNYVSNAINHVNEEKVVEVKIRMDGDKLHTTVFNTGAPIPEEDIDHIWDMFYKVDKARTKAYGGNGIGLAIVKAIMNSLNQKFGVENYENGVAFWFELDAK